MATTPKVRRLVYKKVDGQLIEPQDLLVWCPTFGAMFAKIETGISMPNVTVYVYQDPVTTQLYYEASDLKR